VLRVGVTQEGVGLMVAIYSLSRVKPRRHDVTKHLVSLDGQKEYEIMSTLHENACSDGRDNYKRVYRGQCYNITDS